MILRRETRRLPTWLIDIQLPSWLQPASDSERKLRNRFVKEAFKLCGIKAAVFIPYYEWVNFGRHVRQKLHLATPKPESVSSLHRREWLGLGLLGLVSSCVTLTGNTNIRVPLTESAFFNTTPVATVEAHPANWLDGTANLKGSKAAVMGAFNYATGAGYTFAASRADRDRLVANGTLVRLEGKYIELVGVSNPYVLPATAEFTNRLGKQYASQGCGKLQVSGAMRPLDLQKTLGNGSDFSVHPTGMAVDLRRVVPENEQQTFCLDWLLNTFKKVEADRRIDVTAEDSPRHFHVVVEPHDYEKWFRSLSPKLDPEVEALTKALYFEAAFNESGDGYRAIAAVVKNRARSHAFPNTILEVVAQGAAGRHAGSCQFSFMCDGKAENPQILCGQHPEETRLYWQGVCKNRWEAMVKAAQYLIETKDDPTGGAVLYYTGDKPYWADSDMKAGTVRKIGNHVFACSNRRGKDVCTTPKGRVS